MGYDINRIRKYVLRFEHMSVIGIFNCTFDERAMFVYQCKSECTGYFLRKRIWRSLLNDYHALSSVLKLVIHEDYIVNIKTKILTEKSKTFQKISKRADFTHILTIIPNLKQTSNTKFVTKYADNDNYMKIKEYDKKKVKN